MNDRLVTIDYCDVNYTPEAKHSYRRITEILYGAKYGVHAFDYNSAESEPIWIKSGAL